MTHTVSVILCESCIKVKRQLEICLEPVGLCDYACEIRHEMCQVCTPVMTRLEEKCYSNLFSADFFWS